MASRDEIYLNTKDAYYWLFYCVSNRIAELEELLPDSRIPIDALRRIGQIVEELKKGQITAEEIAISEESLAVKP